MGVVRFALRWPYTFFVLALLIMFLGVTAFRSMPADIFPEIDIPVVTVIWPNAWAKPERPSWPNWSSIGWVSIAFSAGRSIVGAQCCLG